MSAYAYDDAHPRPSAHPVLSEFIAAATDLLAREQLHWTLDDDLDGWCKIITGAPRTGARSRAFVRGESDPPDDAYWIHLAHRDGRTAAIIAARYFDTNLGMWDYIREGRLWSANRTPMKVDIPGPGPRGRMAHTGGLWVSPDPDFSGRGISWLLTRLNHIVALTRWDCDFVFGMCLEQLIAKGVAKNYGAEETLFLMSGPFGKGGAESRLYVLQNSGDFLIQRAWDDLKKIRYKDNQQMRDIAPFAKR